MTTTLIVLAHPDGRSFNAGWAQATAAASEALGHRVLWSDLYAMGFRPDEAAARYDGWDATTPFDPLKAQEAGAADGTLPEDVLAEIDKIGQADRVIFHFPIWWFAPPAILKGWCDRALAHGALHTVDQRFDTGLCRGKTALFCVTTGAIAAECGFDGKEGDVRLLLWPLAYTLRYLGFDVLEPRLAHGVHGYHKGARQTALREQLGEVLAAQVGVIAQFDDLPRMRFNPDGDFDDDGRLSPTAPSHTPFIRHTP